MKLYKVSFDCSTVVVLSENIESLYKLISKYMKGMSFDGKDIYIDWGWHNLEKCHVEEINPNNEVIINWESH